MKKKTQQEIRRFQMMQMTSIIMQMTGMTELEYCFFKYNTGLEYLAIVCNGNVLAFKELEESKIFWNWWKNLWLIRDEEFNYPDMRDIAQEQRMMIYRQLHSARMLANPQAPGGEGLKISFNSMLNAAAKNIEKEIYKNASK